MRYLVLWKHERRGTEIMAHRVAGSTRFVAALLTIALSVGALPIVLSEDPIVQTASAQDGGIVKVGWVGDFMNWNPLKAEFVSDWVAYNLIFSTLFQYDEDWDKIENHLAMGYYQVEWPSGNMSTYINITENAYFRNAEDPNDMDHPLTAEDIKFTIELIQANAGSSWDYYVLNITDVYALSDYQVQIDTEYTKATLIDDLVWVPILPKFQWELIQGGAILGNFNPKELIGSGPFYYRDGIKNDWHEFIKAPNFHAATDYLDERDIDFEGIQYRDYSDVQGLALAIDAGEVDVVDVTGAQEPVWNSIAVDADVPVTKQVTQELGIYDIAINAIPIELREAIGYADDPDTANKLLLDREVRKAIGMTLNREALCDVYFYGLPEPADTVLNPGFWHADLSNPLPYDPDEARQVLLDAGYDDVDEDGDYLEATEDCYPVQQGWAEPGERLRFNLHVPEGDPGYATVGTAWVDWAKLAGIQFDFEVLPTGPMTNEEWYKCNYDIWVWSWYWGPEPLSNLGCWLTSQIRQGGYNCVGPICQGGLNDPDDGWWWVDEEEALARCDFDDVFDEALGTTDKDDRQLLVHELQEKIYETYTEFPPLHPPGLYAYTTARYEGWGDWETHVARTIISDMLWLWYDLEPVDSNNLPVFETTPQSQYEVEVGVPQTFVISVSDAEGDDITVDWSAGDGATFSETLSGDTAEPTTAEWTHQYDTVGEYTLRIGLSDEHHEFENVELADVTVVLEANLGPNIEGLFVTPQRAYVGEETTWTVSASDMEQGPDGEGLTFTWDWGDGTYTSTEYQPVENGTMVQDEQTHSWDSNLRYYVEVWVWDGFGDESNPLHNVSVAYPGGFQIHVNEPPTVPMATNISGLVGQPVACEAVASDPDPDVLTFTWDWGDGTSDVTHHDVSSDLGQEVASTVIHEWDTPGNHPVEIWVDDGEDGHNVSTTINAVILPAGSDAPPGSITIMQSPNPGTVDLPTILRVGAADANEDSLTVTIDFGDESALEVIQTAGGTTDMQYAEFSHIYDEEGPYMVEAYVDDGSAGGNISATKEVLIVVNTPPAISLASSYSFYYNQSRQIRPASLSDLDGDVLTLWYDWGDDSPISMGDPENMFAASHTYNRTGDFELTAFVDDGKGNTVNASAAVNVQDANRKPSFVGLPEKSSPLGDQYVPGEAIHFNVTVYDKEGDNITVSIDFGDDSDLGTFQYDATAGVNRTVEFIHAYDEAGEYSVVVTVKDDQDHSDMNWTSVTTQVTVEEDAADGTNIALMLGIAALVVAALIAAMILMKRKGKEKTPGGMGDMEGMGSSDLGEEPPAGDAPTDVNLEQRPPSP